MPWTLESRDKECSKLLRSSLRWSCSKANYLFWLKWPPSIILESYICWTKSVLLLYSLQSIAFCSLHLVWRISQKGGGAGGTILNGIIFFSILCLYLPLFIAFNFHKIVLFQCNFLWLLRPLRTSLVYFSLLCSLPQLMLCCLWKGCIIA